LFFIRQLKRKKKKEVLIVKSFKNFLRAAFIVILFASFCEVGLMANERGRSSRPSSVRTTNQSSRRGLKSIETGENKSDTAAEKILSPEELTDLIKKEIEEEKAEEKDTKRGIRSAIRERGKGRSTKSAGAKTEEDMNPEVLMKKLEKTLKQEEKAEEEKTSSQRGLKSRSARSSQAKERGSRSSSGRGVRSVGGVQQQEPVEIARNKKYFASGSKSGPAYEGDKVIDGDPSSFWYTQDTIKTFTVDLGKEMV